MHDRWRRRHLSQRRLRLLQALDRYRRRDLGRSRQPPRSRRPVGLPRRCRFAIRSRAGRGERRMRLCRQRKILRRRHRPFLLSELLMQLDVDECLEVGEAECADRIGMAKLAKMAFDGKDLRPLWRELIAKLHNGTVEAGEGLDLSLIAQLLGDKPAGLAIQHEVLKSHQLYRSPCASGNPRLRVLALAAPTDMGSNTPIEFLLEDSGIELMMLYVIPGLELPSPLPDHDVAIVIASDSEDCRDALRTIGVLASNWPRPLLNPPHLVGNLDRDKLHG